MKEVIFEGPAFSNAFKTLYSVAGAKQALFGLAAQAVIAIAGYLAAVDGLGIYLGVWD